MARPKTKIEKNISLTPAQISKLDELKVAHRNNMSATIGSLIEQAHKDTKEHYSDKMMGDLRTLTMEVLLENQKLNQRIAILEKDHVFYLERFDSHKRQIEMHTKFMNILKKDWHDWMKILTKVIQNPELSKQKTSSEKTWAGFIDEQKNKVIDKLSGK